METRFAVRRQAQAQAKAAMQSTICNNARLEKCLRLHQGALGGGGKGESVFPH